MSELTPAGSTIPKVGNCKKLPWEPLGTWEPDITDLGSIQLEMAANDKKRSALHFYFFYLAFDVGKRDEGKPEEKAGILGHFKAAPRDTIDVDPDPEPKPQKAKPDDANECKMDTDSDSAVKKGKSG